MRIVIAGPGALGCLFAALLSHKKQGNKDNLWLLDHKRERAALLNSQGIVYETDRTEQRILIPVTADPQAIQPADIVLFCVKSYDLDASIQFSQPLISPSTLLVFLQNGINHLDIRERMNLPSSPLFASSSEGATLLEPGHIRHAGHGTTELGFLQSPTERQQLQLKELHQTLEEAGLAVSLSQDIRSRLWAKLFINAAINPLTALYNRSNGQLLTSCAARGRLKDLVRETETVARAAGITIESDPLQATLDVCKRTARNISSMLQDRRHKRPTEIDAINGAVVRTGKRLGIDTPLNQKVVDQIRKMEQDYSRDKDQGEK